MKIDFLILCGIVVLMQGCDPHKVQKRETAVNETEADAGERYFFRSYEIGKDEVRDTSFTLPRNVLDDPMAFIRTLTDVQMKNRSWTDNHNYPEKLLFGDSIFSKICEKVSTSNGNSIYLLDNITDEDNMAYYLEVGARGDHSYDTYRIMDRCVNERIREMSEPFWELLYEWDKNAMFQIGGTDEWEKTIVSHTGQQVDICTTGRKSGCITRLRCDNDSVYVDMIKLYLWPFDQY